MVQSYIIYPKNSVSQGQPTFPPFLSRGREGGKEGGREGGKEGGREGGREGGKEGRREGGKEGRREGRNHTRLQRTMQRVILLIVQECQGILEVSHPNKVLHVATIYQEDH